MKKLNIFGHLFIILLCIGVTEKTYGMNAFKQRYQNFKQNVTWKKAAMTGFAAGCSLGQVGLTLGGYNSLVPVREYLISDEESENEFENLPDVDPIIQGFVKKQAKEAGVLDLDFLKIKIWGNNFFSAYDTKDNNWIFVPIHEIESLKYVLKIQHNDHTLLNDSAVKYLHEIIGAIEHESGHIIYRDGSQRKIDAFAIPLAFLSLNFLLKKQIKINNYWLKNLDKVITGAVAGPLCAYTFYKRSQFEEYRADDTVADNIHILKADKRYYKKHLASEWVEEFYAGHKKFFRMHPHPKDRIKRFKKRIKALEEKGDPKAFEDPLASKESEIK